MFEFQSIPYTDRKKFYAELASELKALYERYWFTNLSNASAALMAHLPDLNWAGFYLIKDGELRLGPFQGLPACLRIPIGKGVCGTAVAERRVLRVGDVNEFPGHIACDSRSRSELVLPLIHEGQILGVLDLDSPCVNRFSESDELGLKVIVDDLLQATNWIDSGLGI